MPTYEVEVLDSFPFESRDPKKHGAVEVIAKHVAYEDGTSKTFIERRIRVGERFVALPYDGEEVLLDALHRGYEKANERFVALRTSLPRRK